MNMKSKLIVFLLVGTMTYGQIPSIDPTVIQRLIELKNNVSALKKGHALQKISIIIH